MKGRSARSRAVDGGSRTNEAAAIAACLARDAIPRLYVARMKRVFRAPGAASPRSRAGRRAAAPPRFRRLDAAATEARVRLIAARRRRGRPARTAASRSCSSRAGGPIGARRARPASRRVIDFSASTNLGASTVSFPLPAAPRRRLRREQRLRRAGCSCRSTAEVPRPVGTGRSQARRSTSASARRSASPSISRRR